MSSPPPACTTARHPATTIDSDRCVPLTDTFLEATSTASLTVVTDAPPMNEHIDNTCGVLVAASRSEPRHLGTNFFVDRRALEQAIDGLITLPASDKARIGLAARTRFEDIDRGFSERAKTILGC